jgi:glycosyltransferase involved in cell wall biosynthesis
MGDPLMAENERPRKVAVFCNSFLPYSQTFVWDEIRAHERYEVEVFAWRRRNAARFPCAVHQSHAWYPITGSSRRFDAALSRGNFGLVHAHFGWAGVLAMPFARRHGLPLIVTFHGYDVALVTASGPGPVSVWPYTLRLQRLLGGLDLGLCASGELLQMLLAAGVNRDRLLEHRLGVDLKLFRSGRRDPACFTVTMVGRFVEKKGFAYGIRAFALALRGSPVNMRLKIAGDGPMANELAGLVKDLGIGESVEFLGALQHSEIARLLSTSDALLAPSVVARDGDRDSGLLSAKEASACECVPVSTYHGGIPDIVDHGVTGFLVAERDVEGMAARLEMLRDEPGLARQMGSAARARMEKEYSLRASVARLEDIYDEVVRRHTPRQRLSAAGVLRSPSSQK